MSALLKKLFTLTNSIKQKKVLYTFITRISNVICIASLTFFTSETWQTVTLFILKTCFGAIAAAVTFYVKRLIGNFNFVHRRCSWKTLNTTFPLTDAPKPNFPSTGRVKPFSTLWIAPIPIVYNDAPLIISIAWLTWMPRKSEQWNFSITLIIPSKEFYINL